jgi:hypothetical protein
LFDTALYSEFNTLAVRTNDKGCFCRCTTWQMLCLHQKQRVRAVPVAGEGTAPRSFLGKVPLLQGLGGAGDQIGTVINKAGVDLNQIRARLDFGHGIIG